MPGMQGGIKILRLFQSVRVLPQALHPGQQRIPDACSVLRPGSDSAAVQQSVLQLRRPPVDLVDQ